MVRSLAAIIITAFTMLAIVGQAAPPILPADVQCVVDKWGTGVKRAAAALDEITRRVEHASLAGLEAGDKGYLTDHEAGFGGRWMDDGERDDSGAKRDESARVPEGGAGGVEAGLMYHLEAHREGLARQRDVDRQQRLLMHLQHMKAHGHHQPKLKRRDSKGRIISTEEAIASGSRFEGTTSGVLFAFRNDLSGIFKFILTYLLDLCAVCALCSIPIVMIRQMGTTSSRRRAPRRSPTSAEVPI